MLRGCEQMGRFRYFFRGSGLEGTSCPEELLESGEACGDREGIGLADSHHGP
jgi:hypothetical protein